MEKITSASILESLRKGSEARLETHRRKINDFARSILENTEAIVGLIFITGELHVNLKDHRIVNDVIDGFYGTDERLCSSVRHGADASELAVSQGNARIITKPGATEESVCIICTYRFTRKVLDPKLLPELVDAAKSIASTWLLFNLIDVHSDLYPGRDKDKPKWTIAIEARDNSVIITLS